MKILYHALSKDPLALPEKLKRPELALNVRASEDRDLAIVRRNA